MLDSLLEPFSLLDQSWYLQSFFDRIQGERLVDVESETFQRSSLEEEDEMEREK